MIQRSVFLASSLLWLGTVLLFCSVGRAEGAEGELGPIKVMSYNLRFNNPRDGDNAWPHRKEWVAEILQRERLDLLGVQEALAGQVDFLQQQLDEFEVYSVGRDDGKRKGEATAIFYRKERFERVDAGTFWLSDKPDVVGSVGWDAALTRICSWVRLRDRKSGRLVVFFNTHFDHVGEQARRESATLIRKKVVELAGDAAWVITGDFNAFPDSPVIERMIREEDALLATVDTRSSKTAGHKGPNSSWCGFHEIVPDRRIDYVFTSPTAEVLETAILTDQRDGRFPSDHLPVTATLVWSE